MAIPRGGRPLVIANAIPARCNFLTASRAREVSTLSLVTSVPSTSATRSLTSAMMRPALPLLLFPREVVFARFSAPDERERSRDHVGHREPVLSHHFLAGRRAPKRSTDKMSPCDPAQRSQPIELPASTASRAVTDAGNTLSRYSCALHREKLPRRHRYEAHPHASLAQERFGSGDERTSEPVAIKISSGGARPRVRENVGPTE